MPDIDDIFDDEEDRATYAMREDDGPAVATAATPEELAAKLRQITETHAKATGGIWYSHGGYLSTRPSITNSIYDLDEMGQKTMSSPFQAVPFYSQGDANFCASAHQDVPWLVELAQSQARKIEAQRAEIGRLRASLENRRQEVAECYKGIDEGRDEINALTAENARLRGEFAGLTAERDRMREALERIAKGETVAYDADDLEEDVITTMDDAEMREIARAALQPQEAHQ